MSRKAIFLPLIITLVFAGLLLGLISSCAPPSGTGMFGDRIGLLYIDGIIMSGKSSDSFLYSAGVTSDHIVEVVRQAIDDKGIKALVVRINSPGGSASASQEIYDAFKRFSDTGRPVIVSMADVAASGGYYIASPADEIFANPATLTGSIGVIMQFINYEGLFDIVGLYDETLKAGEFKDIGNPTRPMTDEERALLQTMLDEVHGQFIDAVKEGRGFKDEQIDAIANGMIFSGEQAVDNGLVDKLGGLQDAINRASEIAGLGDHPVIDELGKVGLLDQLLEDLGAAQSQAVPPAAAGLSRALGGAFNAGQNPFYRLWSLVLLDPRFVGDESGIRF
jgi:protease-4